MFSSKLTLNKMLLTQAALILGFISIHPVATASCLDQFLSNERVKTIDALIDRYLRKRDRSSLNRTAHELSRKESHPLIRERLEQRINRSLNENPLRAQSASLLNQILEKFGLGQVSSRYSPLPQEAKALIRLGRNYDSKTKAKISRFSEFYGDKYSKLTAQSDGPSRFLEKIAERLLGLRINPHRGDVEAEIYGLIFFFRTEKGLDFLRRLEAKESHELIKEMRFVFNQNRNLAREELPFVSTLLLAWSQGLKSQTYELKTLEKLVSILELLHSVVIRKNRSSEVNSLRDLNKASIKEALDLVVSRRTRVKKGDRWVSKHTSFKSYFLEMMARYDRHLRDGGERLGASREREEEVEAMVKAIDWAIGIASYVEPKAVEPKAQLKSRND